MYLTILNLIIDIKKSNNKLEAKNIKLNLAKQINNDDVNNKIPIFLVFSNFHLKQIVVFSHFKRIPILC